MFKPSGVLFTDSSKAVFLLWIFFLKFMFHVCLYYTVLSVPCSIVITCWERADLLVLLCVMFSCVFYAVSTDICDVPVHFWLLSCYLYF